MFEGLVHQLLVGYLGKYIKDLQKEQFRFSMLRGEVLLEKAELVLEAFDYLQLPFAIHKGLIGKLSIQIPWKKLGWDPIRISLEDVYISTCRRDDSEWTAEAVCARELGAKRAKLAAAELAKLSKRVSDNHSGQSFISYITAKIIDNIQITVENVHIEYIDATPNSRAPFSFGVTLYKLMVTTTDIQAQMSSRSNAVARPKGSNVTKLLEIQDIGMYWNSHESYSNETTGDNSHRNIFLDSFHCDQGVRNYILRPLNATVSLTISKSGGGQSDNPQYGVHVNLNELALTLDEKQTYQMIMLWDFIVICRLREKYGRFRPQGSFLSRNVVGWQKAWWQYALISVLYDVRKELRHTAWSSLGERLNARRQYVKLYRLKLEHLRQGKHFDDKGLEKLEDMERELEMDEILSYRSHAESQLQKASVPLKVHEHENITESLDMDKYNGDRSSSKPRGWLNWLSLGMLGAGGTTDSSQFAGVISDEEIKDIYEATKYHPPSVLDQGDALKGHNYLLALSVEVQKICATLNCMRKDVAIMSVEMCGAILESDILYDSASVSVMINSLEVLNPFNNCSSFSHVFQRKKKMDLDKLVGQRIMGASDLKHFVAIKIAMLQQNSSNDFTVRVTLQPFELKYDTILFENIFEFVNLLSSYKSHQDLVLHALEGFENFEARLLSKARYILSNRKRVYFEIKIENSDLIVPCQLQNDNLSSMVFSVDCMSVGLSFAGGTSFSDFELKPISSRVAIMDNGHAVLPRKFLSIGDICDCFEFKWSTCEVKLDLPKASYGICLMRGFNGCIKIEKCIIKDESLMNQLKISGAVPSTKIVLSFNLLNAVKEICSVGQFSSRKSNKNYVSLEDFASNFQKRNKQMMNAISFEVTIRMPSLSVEFLVDRNNDGCEDRLLLQVQVVDMLSKYIQKSAGHEVSIRIRSLSLGALNPMQNSVLNILKTKESDSSKANVNNDTESGRVDSAFEALETSVENSDCLHIHSSKTFNFPRPVIHVYLKNVEGHCYPPIVGYVYNMFSSKVKEIFSMDAKASENELNGIETLSRDFKTGKESSQLDAMRSSNNMFIQNASLFHWQSPFTRFEHDLNAEVACQESIEKLETKGNHDSCSGMNADNNNNARGTNISDNFIDLELVINVEQTDVHFHDSSFVVATIVIPKSESFVLFSGSEDSWDIQSSFEAIRLDSALLVPPYGETIYGSIDLRPCPVLNTCFKKIQLADRTAKLEMNASIEHAFCILHTDLLAIIIGYFKLSHWGQYLHLGLSELQIGKSMPIESAESQLHWKVEVADSFLLLPVESSNHAVFLKLDLPKLFFEFHSCCSISRTTGYERKYDIPEVSSSLLANVMNFTFEQLLLSYRTKQGISKINSMSDDLDFSLFKLPILKLWIEIPSDTPNRLNEFQPSHTKIVLNTGILEANIIENSFDSALQAIMDLGLELASIDAYADLFSTSVQQFFESKTMLMQSKDILSESPKHSIITLTAYASQVSLTLHGYKGTSNIHTIGIAVAKGMRMSACWENEFLQYFDVEAFSLELTSNMPSVVLLKCNSEETCPQGIYVHFITPFKGEFEAAITLPHTSVWLHMKAWNEVVMFCHRFMELSSSSLGILERRNLHGNGETPNEHMKIKAEKMMVAIHIPELLREESSPVFMQKEEKVIEQHAFDSRLQEGGTYTENSGSMPQKYLVLSLCLFVNSIELSNAGIAFNGKITSMEGKLESIGEAHRLPFCQISGVEVEGKICNEISMKQEIGLLLHIDTIDIWCSYPILLFWHNFRFWSDETASSTHSNFSMNLDIGLRKGAFVLYDGRWNCNAPIFESFLRHVQGNIHLTTESFACSVSLEVQIDYHNIHKVTWEPFMEPWNLECNISRKFSLTNLLGMPPVTEVNVLSMSHLNVNVTEAFVQAAVRCNEMITNIWASPLSDSYTENHEYDAYHLLGYNEARRYAPYFLQNDTGMLLNFWLLHSQRMVENESVLNGGAYNTVEPGCLIPLFLEETPEELFQRWKPNHSSERVVHHKTLSSLHHMICLHFNGTMGASIPMSMDLVGLRSFEMELCNAVGTSQRFQEQNLPAGVGVLDTSTITSSKSKRVPLIFEVSMQRYSKLVRLYSTVTILNATSVALEICFDIHIGIDPKIMDPILPGQELPLPVHLAETGQIRLRPVGSNYVWSEAQSLTNILYNDSRLGQSRSFVCYPSNISSGLFRCYISLNGRVVPLVSGSKHLSVDFDEQCSGVNNSMLYSMFSRNTRTIQIRQIVLSAPLVIKNLLPLDLDVSVRNGAGISVNVSVSEGSAASVFEIDASHDVVIVINAPGFMTSTVKFSRLPVHDLAEKGNGKLFFTESLTIIPKSKGSAVYVRAEKLIETRSGSRELSLSVPFWLYNCTGLTLVAIDGDMEQNLGERFLSSIYPDSEEEHVTTTTFGSGIACVNSGNQSVQVKTNKFRGLNSSMHSAIKNHLPSYKYISSASRLSDFQKCPSIPSLGNSSSAGIKMYHRATSESLLSIEKDAYKNGSRKGVKEVPKAIPCLHSPARGLEHTAEAILRLGIPQFGNHASKLGYIWSNPFSLNPPNGSATVIIPQTSTKGAVILAVTRTPVYGLLSGKTTAITFQPRYVISNACSHDICSKQAGTLSSYLLHAGEHMNLHWDDIQRDFLMSVRFNEPGWGWSGSFHPDKLGDALVKMRNYISGALQMVRVEVQIAGESFGDAKHTRQSDGSTGTYLVLLSEDETGFMPYRIDNFSMERLRFYQQNCEKFEHTLQPYTCCSYAWDEPCQPYQLVIEVPGEGLVGVYSLDEVKDHSFVQFSGTCEKPERKFSVSVHAEGPIKVLSFTSSSLHMGFSASIKSFDKFVDRIGETRKLEENHSDLIDAFRIRLPFVGISIINSTPQELAYFSAKGINIELVQDTHQQELSFQIAHIQLDNQLARAVYPVTVSTENTASGLSLFEGKQKYNGSDINFQKEDSALHEASNDAAFFMSIRKWKHMATSVECFDCINVSLVPLRIELEEQFIMQLVEFSRAVSLRLMNGNNQVENFDTSMDYTNDKGDDWFATYHFKFLKRPYSNRSQFIKVMERLNIDSCYLPSTARLPVGAPWQNISILARKRKKIYIENFQIAAVKLTVSFSSSPWLSKDGNSDAKQLVTWSRSMLLQRGLMALVDIEGVPISLRPLNFTHSLASQDDIQGMVIRHYTRQLLHEWYKVLGSVGMFGNPMEFARSLGFGIREFISVPAKSIVQNPGGIFTSMVQGSKSLFSNTVFAFSNAATQFSKAAHKGVAAFAFDEEYVAEMGRRQHAQGSYDHGVLNAFLEGLTGFLQSPIRGAEKHGLPGIVSGVAIGTVGLILKPVVSILDLAGQTAQSIRNRSNPRQQNRFRVRLPRPLMKDSKLMPYSWEAAVGTAILQGAVSKRFRDEDLVTCTSLKSPGDFVLITKRLVVKVSNHSILGAYASCVAVAPIEATWNIEFEIDLDSIIHVETDGFLLNILAGNPQTHSIKLTDARTLKQNTLSKQLPITQRSLELPDEDGAKEISSLLLHLIDERKKHHPEHVLHRQHLRSNFKVDLN